MLVCLAYTHSKKQEHTKKKEREKERERETKKERAKKIETPRDSKKRTRIGNTQVARYG